MTTTFFAMIKGTTALLQHRFSEQDELPEATRKVHVKRQDPRTAAEACSYRNNKGELYLPGAAIARMLREAGGAHKQRGSRKSLKYIVPAAILVPDDIILLRDEQSEPLTNFEVDSRPVVIPSTKGRIMRHRPRLNAWWMEFNLEIDEDSIDPETVHLLLTEGGQKLGLGDFRPEKGGPFGRFQVVLWSEEGATLKEAAD
jgi:hypothetical protein